MIYAQPYKAGGSGPKPRYLKPGPQPRRQVRTAAPGEFDFPTSATLPAGQILTLTHRFDNLLSSKTGPNGTQAFLARRCRSNSVVSELSAPNGYIWDLTTRRQTIAVKDAATGAVLNTQNLNSSFNGGLYLSWTITGHVKLVFTNVGSSRNAVVSGLFFDSFPTPPTGGYGVIAMGAGLTRSIGVDANGHPVVRQYHTDAQARFSLLPMARELQLRNTR